jgi:amino acid adenylation domain-containing protein
VAIMLAPSVKAVVTILAVLKAGAGYLAVDPRYPTPWIEYVLSDSRAIFVVTDDDHTAAVADHAPVVQIEAMEEAATALGEVAPLDRANPGDLACVLYTGGSTGRPKGVMIEHRNLAHHAAYGFAPMAITSADRCPQFASLSFDASVEEILFTVTTGATLVLRSADFDIAPSRFVAWCRAHRLTALSLPTSYWHELVDSGATDELAASPTLRVITIGGEAASADRIRRWHNEGGGRVRLLNAYAPSECTISSSWCELTADVSGTSVSIGRPVTNCQLYVLDEAGEPVGLGVIGELHVGGHGVSRGYIGRPDLTARAFLPNHLTAEPGTRLYRTGDRARYLPDGSLTVLGRLDDQIKLRGYRIEPGDVEAAVRRHPTVKDALVRVREDTPGDRRLVAYVVPGFGSDAEIDRLPSLLHESLTNELPGYLVPSAFVVLDKLPRTPSGKLDAERLPRPVQQASPDKNHRRARTATELRLLTLWSDLLGRPDVGVDDDFFESGGHSLLAVQLVARIEREFGRTLSVGALFPRATVVRVAQELDAGLTDSSSVAVPLRVGKATPTAVLVHPVGGDVVSYVPLAAALAPLNVFGLRSPGLDSDDPPGSDMLALATAYVAELSAVGVLRPRLIGGWSFGGSLALEVGRRFAEDSGEPPTVLVIDGVPGRPGGMDGLGTGEGALQRAFAQDVRRSLGALLPAQDVAQASDPDDVLGSLTDDLLAAGLVDTDSAAEWMRRRLRTFSAHVQATAAHEPAPYPGDVLLVLAANRPDHDRVVAGWAAVVTGTLTVHTVPGDHYSIMRQAAAAEIAGIAKELMIHDEASISAVSAPGAARSS